MADLRNRILHTLIDSTPAEYLAPPNDLSRIVDAVIREFGPIPDRTHVDDQGRIDSIRISRKNRRR